jgi:hypothetical protein
VLLVGELVAVDGVTLEEDVPLDEVEPTVGGVTLLAAEEAWPASAIAAWARTESL